MKHIRNLINGLIVGGVAMAMVASLSAQSTVQGSAKVVRIKGSARYATVANQWQPLEVGAELKPGTVVQTGMEAGSYVDVVLYDGGISPVASALAGPAVSPSISDDLLIYRPTAAQNVVRVMENTVLGIDKLTVMDTGADKVTETQLDLRTGKIFGSVKKMSAASKYEVKIPNGVAGIRGTLYSLDHLGNLAVYVGQVVLSQVGSDGSVNTQVVNGGQELIGGRLRSIPAGRESEARTFAGQINFISQQELNFVPDRTIYYVSPVGAPEEFGDFDF